MSLTTLPPEIVLHILDAAASNSLSDLQKLSRISPPIYSIYKSNEFPLLRTTLQSLTGYAYKCSLERAWLDLNNDDDTGNPDDTPPLEIVRRALMNHPDIVRFARFCHSLHILHDFELGPLEIELEVWTMVIYAYAAFGRRDDLLGDPGTRDPFLKAMLMLHHRIFTRIAMPLKIRHDARRELARSHGMPVRGEPAILLLGKPKTWRLVGEFMGVWEPGFLESWEVKEEADFTEENQERFYRAVDDRLNRNPQRERLGIFDELMDEMFAARIPPPGETAAST